MEFIDNYGVSDQSGPPSRAEADGRPKLAELQRELTPDLLPAPVDYQPGSHPFGRRYLRRNSQVILNLSSYSRILLEDFTSNGSRSGITEFTTPANFARVKEKTLVNCTGYGARALFNDTSITPVRGQITRLISGRTPPTDCTTRTRRSCRGGTAFSCR